jgi:cytochrome P450
VPDRTAAPSSSTGRIPEVALGPTGLAGAVPDLVELYEHGEHVVRATSAGGDLLFLIGPDANRTVMTSARDHFNHGDGWGPIFGDPPNLTSADGAEHDAARKAAWPAFTVRRMDDYLPLVDELIVELIERWVDLPEVDVYEETRGLAFDLAAHAFLGVRSAADLEAMREQYLPGYVARNPGPRGAGEQALLRLIAERRDRTIDDALGLLCRAVHSEGRPFTDAELIAHAKFLIEAGFETTANLGAWALYLLSAHPEYEARVRHEVATLPLSSPPTYDQLRAFEEVDRLLLETERLYPPVPYGPRGVEEPVEVDGHVVEPGPIAMWSASVTHRLPSLWRNPEAFDPDRFAPPREEHRQHPYALVGFGGGPRRCMGLTFARTELTLLVARVEALYRLEPVADHEVTQVYGITARPLGGMRLRALPRVAVG